MKKAPANSEIKGHSFQEARERLGISLQELAQRSCFSVHQIEQIENGLIPDVKLLNGYLNNSSPDFPKAFGKVRQIQEAITYLKNDLQIAANLFQDKIYIDEDF